MRLRPSAAGLALLYPSAIIMGGLLPGGAQPAQAPEAGIWIDHTGQGAVELAPCGSRLCGHIVWLKQPNTARGKPLVDINNPEPSKRTRLICGLPVIGSLQRQSGGGWDAGWVYDPKTGKMYDLALQAAGRNRLSVTGYMGTKFFSQTVTWTRAAPGLPNCRTGAATQTASGTGAPQTAPAKREIATAGLAPGAAVPPSGVGGPLPRTDALRGTPPHTARTATGTGSAGPVLPARRPPVPAGEGAAAPSRAALADNDTPVLISPPVLAKRRPKPSASE